MADATYCLSKDTQYLCVLINVKEKQTNEVTGSHRNPLMFNPVAVQPSPEHFYLQALEAPNTQHGSN